MPGCKWHLHGRTNTLALPALSRGDISRRWAASVPAGFPHQEHRTALLAGEICDIYKGAACERCEAGYYLERDTKQCKLVRGGSPGCAWGLLAVWPAGGQARRQAKDRMREGCIYNMLDGRVLKPGTQIPCQLRSAVHGRCHPPVRKLPWCHCQPTSKHMNMVSLFMSTFALWAAMEHTRSMTAFVDLKKNGHSLEEGRRDLAYIEGQGNRLGDREKKCLPSVR